MSHKNNVHGIDVGSDQSAEAMNYRRLFLFALGVAMIIALVGLAASLGSSTSTITSGGTAVPYSNALEMQYAQPWLDAQKNTAPVPYSDALEMQYAQPWLDKQMRETAVNRYNNALEMQYAQPWLDAQKDNAGIQYGNGMALFYALQNGYRPLAKAPSCNDRADWLYACQNSSWRPGE